MQKKNWVNLLAGPRGCDVACKATWLCGGVRPPSPPRHDTTAPEEPTPTRVQPPRQAKTKDADFHYTKWGLHLATTDFIRLARAGIYRSTLSFISHFCSPHVFKRAFAYLLLSLLGLGGGFPSFRDPSLRPFPFVNLISFLWAWVWVVGLKWALSSLGPPWAL